MQPVLSILRQAVERRRNILISGGTDAGKTTLLNALSAFIPNSERLILIEDTTEIQVEKSNLVRMEARREQPGLPAVTIRDLLRAALRHRPDRIIVGEVRGGEAFDLLQASEYWALGEPVNPACKLGESGLEPVGGLCPSERRGASVFGHSLQHCRFDEPAASH
jgi:energy-coupling factor transporter ATP-binding protein EcfA2